MQAKKNAGKANIIICVTIMQVHVDESKEKIKSSSRKEYRKRKHFFSHDNDARLRFWKLNSRPHLVQVQNSPLRVSLAFIFIFCFDGQGSDFCLLS